jgi:hypothetical protein
MIEEHLRAAGDATEAASAAAIYAKSSRARARTGGEQRADRGASCRDRGEHDDLGLAIGIWRPQTEGVAAINAGRSTLLCGRCTPRSAVRWAPERTTLATPRRPLVLHHHYRLARAARSRLRLFRPAQPRRFRSVWGSGRSPVSGFRPCAAVSLPAGCSRRSCRLNRNYPKGQSKEQALAHTVTHSDALPADETQRMSTLTWCDPR